MNIKFALTSLLLIGLSNCGPVKEKNTDLPKTCDAQCQSEATTLKASFVSGHLGNYSDCPQDGFTGPQDGFSGGDDGDSSLRADCVDENCGAILNCEKASAILRLSISGDNDATGILVQKIELKNQAGDSVAILPLESVTLVENNQQFSGKVKINETPSIRIDFQGPANPSELLSGSNEGQRFEPNAPGVLHITLTSDNAPDVVVISPATSTIPSIDT